MAALRTSISLADEVLLQKVRLVVYGVCGHVY